MWCDCRCLTTHVVHTDPTKTALEDIYFLSLSMVILVLTGLQTLLTILVLLRSKDSSGNMDRAWNCFQGGVTMRDSFNERCIASRAIGDVNRVPRHKIPRPPFCRARYR